MLNILELHDRGSCQILDDQWHHITNKYILEYTHNILSSFVNFSFIVLWRI